MPPHLLKKKKKNIYIWKYENQRVSVYSSRGGNFHKCMKTEHNPWQSSPFPIHIFIIWMNAEQGDPARIHCTALQRHRITSLYIITNKKRVIHYAFSLYTADRSRERNPQLQGRTKAWKKSTIIITSFIVVQDRCFDRGAVVKVFVSNSFSMGLCVSMISLCVT